MEVINASMRAGVLSDNYYRAWVAYNATHGNSAALKESLLLIGDIYSQSLRSLLICIDECSWPMDWSVTRDCSVDYLRLVTRDARLLGRSMSNVKLIERTPAMQPKPEIAERHTTRTLAVINLPVVA